MPNLSRPPRVRAAERQWTRCDVQGCPKFVHGLSRWCNRHKLQAARQGSPTQRRILRRETMPWEVSASHVIKENLTHPAIVMVVTEFDELLSEAAHRAALNPTPNRQDWSGKTYRELARLHRRGVTGRDVFRIVAGVHFYARALPPNSKAHQFTLARHVLNFTWRERFGGWCERKNFTGWRDRKDTVRLSTRVLENLGRHLAVSTAGVLHAMEPAFDQRLSAPAERRERLSTALEQPFTNSPPNTHERNSPSAILERCPALS